MQVGPVDPAVVMIGQTLSRYKITAKLGEGGMGEVYLAEDTELGREVALKVLPPALAGSPERLARFRREARAVAALNHPNIVTIFNVEEAGGQRLLVMERVEGRSLDRIIRPEGLPLAEVFAIAVPIADALAAAHAAGITHRDLKPANVMVSDDGQVKMLDFGLAKLAVEAADLTLTEDQATLAAPPTASLTGEGVVMGTAPYMSPEQLQGKPVDSRTDIFSFGIMLYEMVVGRRPFQGETGIELASSILKDSPASVTELRLDLPRHLGRIIQHCLEKDPERRFQSAKDVRNELDELRREVETGALEVSRSGQIPVSRPAPPARRTASRIGVGVAALLAVAVLGMLWWRARPAESPSPRPAAVGPRTVAVLPFANLGADTSVDYLRLAVPDEITTTLSRAPGLAIRPFSATATLQTAALDALAVARDLGVGSVVTGQYFQEGDRLSLTLEAIDVERNVVVWRDSVVVSAQELITLRQSVADTVERGLMPVLDAEAVPATAGTRPSNEEAYDLYLRSLSLSSDVDATAVAMPLLEEAVELDPTYAPAWSQLARRYHLHGNYGGGGEEYYERSVAAARQAVGLDPELEEAAMRITLVQVERGQLAEAYAAASRLVAQRPRAARAYFVRSYVLRYGGDLDRAVRDCDTALALDPNNPFFRSCGITNSLAGRYERALQFLELDAGSQFSLDNGAMVRLRQGRTREAAAALRQSSLQNVGAVIAYLEEREPLPPPAVRQIVDATLELRDSEQQYWNGSILAYCGEHAAGLQLIREGIARGFCSYPFMETDPLLAGLRGDARLAAEYAAARAAGQACHEQFLAQGDSS